MSCIGGTFCIAAGSYSKPKTPHMPLIEEWNGRTWRIIPNPPGYLGSITCGGPSFCLAISRTPSPDHTDVWNGRTWRTLNPQPPDINDVRCVSPTFCVTYNYPDHYPEEPTSVVEWNGKTWQNMPQNSGGCQGPW